MIEREFCDLKFRYVVRYGIYNTVHGST